MSKPRIIQSKTLTDMWKAHELSRRSILKGAAAAGATVIGGSLLACGGDRGEGDPPMGVDSGPPPAPDAGTDAGPPPRKTHLAAMGYHETDYMAAFDAAMIETINLDFIEAGDTVYFKVNCNNGDLYPHSTKPELIIELANRCRDHGASRIIVGDRSFWGDTGTLRNMRANGVFDAANTAGAEVMIFDDAMHDWVMFGEDVAPNWAGGFGLPVPVVESNHIINLPCVKTHFISHFTMSLKNVLGIVNPVDRQRPGNLDVHITSRLWRQIAQVNQQITPSLNILDGYEALITGGPTRTDGAGASYADPKVIIVSPDRIAADVLGIAVLQGFSPTSEEVTGRSAWSQPQIMAAVAAANGITSPDMLDVVGPTVPNFEEYRARATA